MDPALIALIGTLFGGVVLKVVESLLNRGKTQSDVAAQIRTELRTDIQALRDEIRKVETELDMWKSKYYDLLDQFYRRGLRPDEDGPISSANPAT